MTDNDKEKDIQKTEKEDVKPIKGENESVELSEEDMEDVAGGMANLDRPA